MLITAPKPFKQKCTVVAIEKKLSSDNFKKQQDHIEIEYFLGLGILAFEVDDIYAYQTSNTTIITTNDIERAMAPVSNGSSTRDMTSLMTVFIISASSRQIEVISNESPLGSMIDIDGLD